MSDKEQTPHYQGHRKRLKERFSESYKNAYNSTLPDYEILEILLFSAYPRQDVKPIAKKLLEKFKNLNGIFSASSEALKLEVGLGDSAITQIKAVHEINTRLLKEKAVEKPVVQSWKAVLDYVRLAMGNAKNEHFRILFLDKKNKIIADEVQQKGTVDETPVYPREVAKRALELSASAVILVHNHPSGDVKPSKADIEITEAIEKALHALEIKIHDHLIVSESDHFSFAGHGLL